MPITASLAITAAGGIGKTIFGLSDLSSAKHEMEQLRQPKRVTSQEWLDNRTLAESRANSGLSDASKNYYTTESQRGLAAGLSASLQGGGSPNFAQDLFDSYNRDLQGVMTKDTDLQSKNIEYFMKANADKAGQDAMNWVVNDYQPYKDKMAALASRKDAATKNIFGGITDVAGAAASFGVAQQNAGLISSGSGAAAPAYTSSASPASVFGDLQLQDPYPVRQDRAMSGAQKAQNFSQNMTVSDMLNLMNDQDKAALYSNLSKAINPPQ